MTETSTTAYGDFSPVKLNTCPGGVEKVTILRTRPVGKAPYFCVAKSKQYKWINVSQVLQTVDKTFTDSQFLSQLRGLEEHCKSTGLKLKETNDVTFQTYSLCTKGLMEITESVARITDKLTAVNTAFEEFISAKDTFEGRITQLEIGIQQLGKHILPYGYYK